MVGMRCLNSLEEVRLCSEVEDVVRSREIMT